jgi:hypothetical protein
MKSSFHRLIPFLPFLLNHLGLPSPELHPILDKSLKWTLLQLNFWKQLTAPLELLVIWPRGVHHGKHRLLLSRIVLGVFTDSLPSNRCPTVARLASRGNVFTESLPSNGSICHNIYRNIYSTRKKDISNHEAWQTGLIVCFKICKHLTVGQLLKEFTVC